ncbi:hypothetical protein QSV08_10410 [Maribacter sp. BPC-D8]|uniref:hypothetical protein n=1 Tax=Maribacter sp. BPC-D8 TaxID=3053613 RepID=UPI002B49E4BB|nr:hypothetical protein [Maribacter sp. BPC-D8]WRI31648.1 hypothetical protein QSV08_10410 [Maribacter sp. BPC-D8]
MKSNTLLFVSIFLLFINEISAQKTNETYDEAINNAIAKQYPEYHTALLKVLDDFELELIIKKVVSDGSYQSYVNLLTKISNDSTYEVVSDFALVDSLSLNSKRYNYELKNIMKSVPLISYRNKAQPKSIAFNQRASEIAAKKKEFSRSDYASLLLEVYDEKDFQIPTIRTQLYRFLDPNTNHIHYIYMGKPTQGE